MSAKHDLPIGYRLADGVDVAASLVDRGLEAERYKRWRDKRPRPHATRVMIACGDAPHQIWLSDGQCIELGAHLPPAMVHAMAAALAQRKRQPRPNPWDEMFDKP